MPSPEEIQLRKIKSVVGDIHDIPDFNTGTSIMSRLYGLLLNEMGTGQVIHHYGSIRRNTVLTLSAASEWTTHLVSDGSYLYAGNNSSPTVITRIDRESFTEADTLTLPTGYNGITGLVIVGRKLYIACSPAAGTHGKVVKVDLDSFTYEAVCDFAANDTLPIAMCTNGTYLFVSVYDFPGAVKEVRLSDFVVESTTTFAAGVQRAYSCFVDGSYLYLGTNGGKILKYRIDHLSGLDHYATLSLPLASPVYAMTTGGVTIYAASYTSPSHLYRIDKDTFTLLADLNLGYDYIYNLVVDQTHIICSSDTGAADSIIFVDRALYKVRYVTDPLSPNPREILDDASNFYIVHRRDPGEISRYYKYPVANKYDHLISYIGDAILATDITCYPQNDPAVALTTAAVAWTFGAYAEVVPANTFPQVFWINGLYVYPDDVPVEYIIQIAYGAAASETIVATIPFKMDTGDESNTMFFPQPIKMAANTRISMRATSNVANADVCNVRAMIKQTPY